MTIKNISEKIFALICILIIYMFLTNMAAAYGLYLPLYREPITIILFIFIILGIINQCFILKPKLNSFLFRCLALFILILIVSIIYISQQNFSLQYSIYQLVSAILWILVFVYSYLTSVTSKNSFKYIKKMVYILPIFLLCFINIKAYSDGKGIPLISSIYYIVFLTPLLFTHKKKIIKIIGLAIIIYALLLSQKRTGLLCLSAFLIIYYFVNAKLKNKNLKEIIKSNFIFILIIGIVATILTIYLQSNNIPIIDKLLRTQEDGGSGRVDIWINLIELLKNSSLLNLIFGNGFNSVYYDLGMQLSAHNDFLEIIYDYGIIGFLLYISLLISVVKKGFVLLKEKNDIASSLIGSVILAIVFSLSSHLIIYPTYFLYFCLFWGHSMGVKEKCNEESKYNNSNI